MAEIPDLNLFMMCEALDGAACTDLPEGYRLRPCRRDELSVWMAFPFDEAAQAVAYRSYMGEYFANVYAPKGDLFFEKCLFVVDGNDVPVATCFAWTAYGCVTTLHWFKVRKDLEGRGIGRALLSAVMRNIPEGEYPVFLHTQPGSYRAIKLYTDFGFALLTDPVVGQRVNGLKASLPILEEHMTEKDYANLRFAEAPRWFLAAADSSSINQF